MSIVAAAGSAWGDHERAQELSRSGEILSLGSIVERAQTIEPGTLLEAELDRENGAYVYEVELATPNGRHVELRFDAKTGELLGQD